jgi:hemerythrin-like domain-containing protein
LIPLSHDHHHGLIEARRLRRAASRGTAERRNAAAAFFEFFARETRWHFRDEEERLFPLLVGADDTATGLLIQALLEHQQLHALAGTLQSDLAGGDVPPGAMRELAHALEQHIRFEERTLFPLIENVASDEALRRLQGSPDAGAAVDTLSPQGTGPLWGAETDDLNATLLAWPRAAGRPSTSTASATSSSSSCPARPPSKSRAKPERSPQAKQS